MLSWDWESGWDGTVVRYERSFCVLRTCFALCVRLCVAKKQDLKLPCVLCAGKLWNESPSQISFNLLTPNDDYSGRTAPLTSKRCILYIYSTHIGTEYFKHGTYSPFFSSKCSLFHNSNEFCSWIIHILYTECAKIKKKLIPAPNG